VLANVIFFMSSSIHISDSIKSQYSKKEIKYSKKALKPLLGLSQKEVDKVCYVMKQISADNSKLIF